MKLKKYIADAKMRLLIWTLTIGITACILFLFHAEKQQQLFVLAVQVLGVLFAVLYDYGRKRVFYEDMEQKLEKLEEKYLLLEMLNKPEFLEGEIFYDTLAHMEKSMNDEIFRQIEKNNAFKRYIETWVHEVKLPIASLRLLLHEYQGRSSRVLKEQVSRIESYVEQVLYYLRSEVPEKDYVIQRYSLRKITDQALAENKDSLILAHMKIQQETPEIFVLTDEKWLRFMLGQIFSNAVKYKKDTGGIHIRAEELEDRSILFIWDNGIGIPEQDLPRVFEKSFTGKNGRIGQASTGMGLYLCGKLSNIMGHKIEIFSKEGEYTEVQITFGKHMHLEKLTEV